MTCQNDDPNFVVYMTSEPVCKCCNTALLVLGRTRVQGCKQLPKDWRWLGSLTNGSIKAAINLAFETATYNGQKLRTEIVLAAWLFCRLLSCVSLVGSAVFRQWVYNWTTLCNYLGVGDVEYSYFVPLCCDTVSYYRLLQH